MFFKTNDGIRINYEDVGQGMPLIFLSGFGGNLIEWEQQQVFFRELGYRTITMDYRNHGRSARTSRGLRVARLSVDLDNLIEKLQLTNVVLIGSSMGAAVIWSYLSLFGTKNVRGSVSIDQSPYGLDDADWEFGALHITNDKLLMDVNRIASLKYTVGKINADLHEKLRRAERDYPFDFVKNESLMLDNLRQDWRDVLGYVQIPQLFLAGAKSPIWSPEHSTFCKEHVRDGYGEQFIFDDVGHLPHLEANQKFNEVLRTWLQKL